MGLFVFGLIVAVIGLVLIGCYKVKIDGRSYAPAWIGGGAIAVLLALAFIFGSMYNSVPARAVGIPISFGHVGKPLGSGIHWEPPWVGITNCPLTQETDIQNGDPHSGSNNYNQAVNISGSDQGGATADVTVQYQINAENAQAVYNKFKCNLTSVRDLVIVQRVRSDIAASAVQYASVDLRAKRQAMEQTAKSLLQADLLPFGITINDVVIADVNLDSIPQQAANQKVAAYNQIGTNQYLLSAAQIAKQTALVNAQAEQAANAAKQRSLSGPVLCDAWIQMMQAALTNPNNHITVNNTAGPCSATSSSASTSVILPSNG